MQHVYGHNGNLGNECADHAAALGTLGFTSSHNVTTRWIHHNFDATACFDGCDNITEILERLQRIRTDTVSSFPSQDLALCSPWSSPCPLCISRDLWSCVSFCSQPFPVGFLLPQASDGQTFFVRVHRTEHRRLLRDMESSIGITFPRAGKWYFRLLSRGNRHGHDRIVLSTLLLLYSVTKKACMILLDASSGTHCPWSFFMFVAPLPSMATS